MSDAMYNTTGQMIINERNIQAAQAQNKEQREWSKEDYEQMRKDYLADREYTNRYNSPIQQMQRLREAGLNPNLLYGKFEAGLSSHLKGPNKDTGKVERAHLVNPLQGNPIDDYFKVTHGVIENKILKEQSRNMQIKNSMDMNQLVRDNMRLGAEMRSPERRGGVNYWESGVTGEIASHQLKKAQLQKQMFDLDIQGKLISQNVQTRQAMVNLLKAEAEVAKSGVEKKYLEKRLEILNDEKKVKELEAKMAEMGIPPNTPWYYIQFNKKLDDFIQTGKVSLTR